MMKNIISTLKLGLLLVSLFSVSSASAQGCHELWGSLSLYKIKKPESPFEAKLKKKGAYFLVVHNLGGEEHHSTLVFVENNGKILFDTHVNRSNKGRTLRGAVFSADWTASGNDFSAAYRLSRQITGRIAITSYNPGLPPIQSEGWLEGVLTQEIGVGEYPVPWIQLRPTPKPKKK